MPTDTTACTLLLAHASFKHACTTLRSLTPTPQSSGCFTTTCLSLLLMISAAADDSHKRQQPDRQPSCSCSNRTSITRHHRVLTSPAHKMERRWVHEYTACMRQETLGCGCSNASTVQQHTYCGWHHAHANAGHGICCCTSLATTCQQHLPQVRQACTTYYEPK